MTRTLLSWLVSARVALSTRLILASLVLAVLPFTLAVDALRLLFGAMRERRLLSAATVRCPAGHEVELHGGWRCSCGITFEGSGFGACPACGERSWIVCACGRAVKNRLAPQRQP